MGSNPFVGNLDFRTTRERAIARFDDQPVDRRLPHAPSLAVTPPFGAEPLPSKSTGRRRNLRARKRSL